jgi:hypothetical protein
MSVTVFRGLTVAPDAGGLVELSECAHAAELVLTVVDVQPDGTERTAAVRLDLAELRALVQLPERLLTNFW